MRVSRRVIFASAVLVAIVPMAALAVKFPGALACAAIDVLPFDSLGRNIHAVNGASENAGELAALRTSAKSRIEAMFGSPRAEPALVFIRQEPRFSLGAMGDTASTYITPMRACIVIGLKGRNVDVLAHEMMHAELAERVGFLARMNEIPVWFDEGLAMQVDRRPAYAASLQDEVDPAIRERVTYRQFFSADNEQLLQNYRAAKAEVARWMQVVGNDRLFEALERARSGETGEDIAALLSSGET